MAVTFALFDWGLFGVAVDSVIQYTVPVYPIHDYGLRRKDTFSRNITHLVDLSRFTLLMWVNLLP